MATLLVERREVTANYETAGTVVKVSMNSE